VAFNFALVCMVNETAISNIDANSSSIIGAAQCGVIGNNSMESESGYDGEFVWDKTTQASLLAAFAFGAILPNIPAGLLADRYGSKYIFATSLFINVITNALTPMAAFAGVPWLFAARMLQGLATAISWPCILGIVPTWGTPTDTGILIALGSSGYQFGPVVAFFTSSTICDSSLRWPFIFYTWAAVAGVLLILWLFLYTDDTKRCKFIGAKELAYLEEYNMRKSAAPKKSLWNVPWKRILCSPCCVATYATQFCVMYCAYYIVDFMPTYSKEVLNFSVRSNGIAASLPPLVQCISRAIFGPFSEHFTFGGRSKTFSVKFFTLVATILPALCFVLVAFLDCRKSILAVVAICVASFFLATSVVGYFKGGILMAPRYAGLTASLENIGGYAAAIVMPYITGAIVKHGTLEEWRASMLLMSAVIASGGIIYLIFGSGYEQEWAKAEKPDTRKVFTVKDEDITIHF